MEFILILCGIYLLLKNDSSSYTGRVFTNPDPENDELPPVGD